MAAGGPSAAERAGRIADGLWAAAPEAELVELPLPRHFEQAAANVTPDDIAEKVPHGPDQQYVEKVKAFVDAGYDHVYLHQIGPDQDGFFDFCEKDIFPRL